MNNLRAVDDENALYGKLAAPVDYRQGSVPGGQLLSLR